MHRIRRQILELELPRAEGALALQREASRLFQEKVLPALDAIFSELAPDDRLIRLDRLEIDLGDLSQAQWSNEFVERCVAKITREVTQQLAAQAVQPTQPLQTLSPAEHAWNTYLYFLEHGILPWNAARQSLRDLARLVEQRMNDQPNLLPQHLLPLLRKSPAALRRLLWQMPRQIAIPILEKSLGMPHGWLEQAGDIWVILTGRPYTDDAAIQLCSQLIQPEFNESNRPAKPDLAYLTAILRRIVPDEPASLPQTGKPGPTNSPDNDKNAPASTPPPETDKPAPKSKLPNVPDPQGQPVQHAGLILLAPYLPAFFGTLQYVQDNQFVDQNLQFRAIHLLHYLSSGQAPAEEPELLLPKIICGLNWEEPIPPVDLSEAEKSECTALLEAAIRNWPALKNTSPDGLRTGFLQRNGLLYWSDDRLAWVLRVERTGIDLLLERLPWTYSVVRLPWMDNMIQVEW